MVVESTGSSWVVGSGRSQLFCHEDIQAACQRHPQSEEVWRPANNQYQLDMTLVSHLAVHPPAPLKLSYDHRPGQHVNCNLMRDPELEVPFQVVLNSLLTEMVEFPLLATLKYLVLGLSSCYITFLRAGKTHEAKDFQKLGNRQQGTAIQGKGKRMMWALQLLWLQLPGDPLCSLAQERITQAEDNIPTELRRQRLESGRMKWMLLQGRGWSRVMQKTAPKIRIGVLWLCCWTPGFTYVGRESTMGQHPATSRTHLWLGDSSHEAWMVSQQTQL